jgi:hypothetical protein
MAAQTYIDGVDVTDIVLEGSATRRLNRPAQATIRVPITDAIGDVGSRLKVVIDGDIFFHGFILMIEDEASEDFGYTTYNATDPMELWQWRVVKDYDGDYSYPSIITDYVTGPQIIKQALANSAIAVYDSTDPDGILFVDYMSGTYEGGGVDMSGAPTDWPMTIAELADLLVSTGELDIILTPIDSGVNMARVDCYNGDYGTDRSGSVSFDYGMGAYNVRAARRAVDMTTMVNKLVYLGGPKMSTIADPNATQHWCFRVNGIVADNFSDRRYYTHAAILAKQAASRSQYGTRMEVRILDAESENCRDALSNYSRDLYRLLWQTETWVRSEPRNLVHVTPIRGTGIGDFDIGDLVTVRAGSVFRGGFSGAQRVYGYTVSWDADGVLELGELQTSADQEG